jgi:hypothetical protein
MRKPGSGDVREHRQLAFSEPHALEQDDAEAIEKAGRLIGS